jgi:hypothetical protein
MIRNRGGHALAASAGVLALLLVPGPQSQARPIQPNWRQNLAQAERLGLYPLQVSELRAARSLLALAGQDPAGNQLAAFNNLTQAIAAIMPPGASALGNQRLPPAIREPRFIVRLILNEVVRSLQHVQKQLNRLGGNAGNQASSSVGNAINEVNAAIASL